MKRILFVCHGNICRSPMAEFYMKSLIEEKGLSGKFEIASAATSAEELGNPVYQPARRKLAEHGINCKGKYARRMHRDDYIYYDLLIGMDQQNLRNMRRICGGDEENKIHSLMEYTGQPRDVADPWYTGDFDATWCDVSEGCNSLLEYLSSEY
ncbi:MAG: low molecular weight protein-tyrosine-phosphatase [Eubacteriales bacterium]|nr:low molecular weight protein-tyrosine-phosphatase [Eubacteriales bacterium]